MKKIVSLMALCAVLFGAVLMVTGCGNKPEKGSVWKITKIIEDGKTETADGVYYCFHTDGNVYAANKDEKGTLRASQIGRYTIKGKKLTIDGEPYDCAISGNKMTLKANGVVVELQKSSDYTEAQIKAAYKPEK